MYILAAKNIFAIKKSGLNLVCVLDPTSAAAATIILKPSLFMLKEIKYYCSQRIFFLSKNKETIRFQTRNKTASVLTAVKQSASASPILGDIHGFRRILVSVFCRCTMCWLHEVRMRVSPWKEPFGSIVCHSGDPRKSEDISYLDNSLI